MTEQSPPNMPPAFLAVPLRLPASVIEVRDQHGDVWVRKTPAPGLVSIPLCAAELLELHAWFDQRSAHAVRQGNPMFWATSEARAAYLLALAVTLVPEMAPIQHQRRQHLDGSSREGTA